MSAPVAVSQTLTLTVPPHNQKAAERILGVLPRTGATIAVLLAIVALLLVVAGGLIVAATRRAKLTR